MAKGKTNVELFGGPLDGAIYSTDELPNSILENEIMISIEDRTIIAGPTIQPYYSYRKDKKRKRKPYKYIFANKVMV